jgi:hypothetical protein
MYPPGNGGYPPNYRKTQYCGNVPLPDYQWHHARGEGATDSDFNPLLTFRLNSRDFAVEDPGTTHTELPEMGMRQMCKVLQLLVYIIIIISGSNSVLAGPRS